MGNRMDWEGNPNVDTTMKPMVGKTAGENMLEMNSPIAEPELGSYGNAPGDIAAFGAPIEAPKPMGTPPSAGGLSLGGIAEIAKAGAAIYDAYNKKKYQDKVFKMEEKRIARETARQDKQQANYDKVFG